MANLYLFWRQMTNVASIGKKLDVFLLGQGKTDGIEICLRQMII